jgi:glycosyltransferase involved in cell wall biosynthesis
MHLGIDGRSLVDGQPARGVGLYTASLIAALAERFPGDRLSVFLPGPPAAAHAPALDGEAIRVTGTRAPRRALYALSALAGRPRLDRLLGGELDAVWLPAPAPVAVSAAVPVVLTVHDLSFEERPADFTPYERSWHRAARPKRLAERAQLVVAVSAATRDAAIAWWGLAPDRVTVARQGVFHPAAQPDARAVERVRREHGLGACYLLFVGALEPRKAPDLLARAYARARRAGLEADLAIVGRGRLAAGVRGPGVRLIERHVPRADLEALYAGALAVVMPSWVEGFGLPPLEAAACGTPAVVSDLPVFDETLGEAALRFPPGDVAALAGALSRIAVDGGLRARLAAAGREAVAGLTWERAARELRGALAAATAQAPGDRASTR